MARLKSIDDLVVRCGELSQMDFEFLYNPARGLLCIGYDVGERRRDPACYDLLAFEARLASFLLIAEGLFPWIPPAEAARLFSEIGARFQRSQLVLDVVHERDTRGLWKAFMRLHSRLDWGLDVAWVFGIREPQDLEAYGPGLKVTAQEKGSAGPIITLSVNAA